MVDEIKLVPLYFPEREAPLDELVGVDAPNDLRLERGVMACFLRDGGAIMIPSIDFRCDFGVFLQEYLAEGVMAVVDANLTDEVMALVEFLFASYFVGVTISPSRVAPSLSCKTDLLTAFMATVGKTFLILSINPWIKLEIILSAATFPLCPFGKST